MENINLKEYINNNLTVYENGWLIDKCIDINNKTKPTANKLLANNEFDNDKVLIRPSPNYDSRPDIKDISLLVIHNISLPPGDFGGNHVIDFFQNNLNINSHEWFENIKGIKVSAHFFVRRCGQIVQFVSTLDRAWHAGVSNFQGRQKCNDFSIGIELEGTDTLAYSESQYQSLLDLIKAIKNRHNITDICGHEHIAPDRKTDPGPAFDWSRIKNKFT